MSRLLILLGALACAQAFPSLPSKVQDRSKFPRWSGNSKIVGGEDATDGEFPFQVALWTGFFGINMFTCGGSVLNENYVITAGHCCTGTADSYNVVAGGTSLYFPQDTKQEVGVTEVIQHEDYNGNTVLNDICLLKLAKPLEWTETVQPVTLPAAGLNFTDGDQFIVSGWGATSEGGIFLPNQLQKVTVPYVDDQTCDDAYGGNAVDETMVCAGDIENGGIDSCQGDSGGPMVLASDKKTLVGVVSWGQGCARPGYPGVYTEVSYFLDWLAANAI